MLLAPLLIPINCVKNFQYRRIKVVLSICLLVSILISLTPEKAATGGPDQKFKQLSVALLGCSYHILRLGTFCEESSGIDSYGCLCINKNAMATMSYCYQSSLEGEKDPLPFLRMCETTYNVTVTSDQFLSSIKNYHLDARIPESSGIVGHPIKLNDSMILLYKNAYSQYLGNYNWSVDYGKILIGYWIGVVMLAAIGNWAKILFPRIVIKMTGRISNEFRKKISLPAAGGRRKTSEKPFFKVLNMLVPTRAESLILAGFLILTLVLLKRNIHTVENDPVFSSKPSALFRYMAVRASILASEIMPLLILFGGRNNFLQWLTRWDYSTFITFHRWISRLVFMLIVIHVACYSVGFTDYFEEIRETYLLWGAIATIAGGFIMIQGLLVLRRKWYEMFLFLHIILAALFIGGAWVHVNDLFCFWFYYYSAALWVFDRVIRVGRIASFGFPNAKVILLADETLKIIVPTPEHWVSIPGGHAFIHFLTPSCFWQSHPFTYTISPQDPSSIVLFVKVKNGVTRTLYNYLLEHPGKSTYIRVAIEGSYGEKTPASRYDTAVFVAGGNGIPGIYAEVIDLAVKSNDLKQALKLVWVVREYKSLLWFYEELLALGDTKIETTIYVTKPESFLSLEDFQSRFHETGIELPIEIHGNGNRNVELGDLSMDGVKDNDFIQKIKLELNNIKFVEGRPMMGFLVSDYLYEAQESAAFITCGHPAMVDDLRASVVKNIDNENHKRIDYFEQLQVWA